MAQIKISPLMNDIVTSITRTTCLVSLTENDFDLKLMLI